MNLFRRKHGSQRTMAPVELTLMPNYSGSGDATITFKGSDDVWYVIRPETMEDVKALMSSAHVVHHNWRD